MRRATYRCLQDEMESITQVVYWKRKVHRIYRVNLSSTVRSAGGLVAFRAVCWGNCSRMLWIELAVCHVGIATVCIASVGIADRQNTSIIRISLKIYYQLRQVCLSVFLSAWNKWATARRNCVKCYIYLYTYTGCPRRNVAGFGRVFVMLKYTDITQNTYVQS